MDELFYCNCGNKGPDGAECPECHSHFALESYKSVGSGIFHLFTVLIGGFLGLILGFLLLYMATIVIDIRGITSILGTIALACPIIGLVLGHKYHKRVERKERQTF